MTAATNAADVQVLIVGAGPVGLTLANVLGLQGVRTLIVEERDSLIDYPRGVGLDDESLRTFQAIGLVDKVLPHTVPNQILRFFDANRKLLVEMAPPDARFGWPKRNGFVQPMVDAELLGGLARFDDVRVQWGTQMTTCTEDADGVTVELSSGESVRASYVVGCDGGRSATRHLMGVSFDGTTSSTRWVVIDLANDPLGHPNSEVGADPERPYVSISIAHGIRRFEFMIHEDESDELASDPAFVTKLLSTFVPHPDKVDIIRHRVYTHHSRIAASFRKGRLMLAGDAAHLMPVWQGQGYNSGIRDAFNLGWKLAAVANGQAGPGLLDSYDAERRKHARAMIDLSTMVGRVISPTNRRVAGLRDKVIRAASIVPTMKSYVLEMRFKPMPRYDTGAVVHAVHLLVPLEDAGVQVAPPETHADRLGHHLHALQQRQRAHDVDHHALARGLSDHPTPALVHLDVTEEALVYPAQNPVGLVRAGGVQGRPGRVPVCGRLAGAHGPTVAASAGLGTVARWPWGRLCWQPHLSCARRRPLSTGSPFRRPRGPLLARARFRTP